MCTGGAEPPDGVAARVAGVAMLSFVRGTREEFQTLQPPDEASYLSNTAVDAAFRRCAELTACCSALGRPIEGLESRRPDFLLRSDCRGCYCFSSR